MVVYADTSFLFSLYARDANTVKAAHIAKSIHAPFVLTPYHQLELRNAMRLSIFRNYITDRECERLLNQLDADIQAGILVETPVVWAQVFAKAEALSETHTPHLGTRAFDILHVATASVLGVNTFFTFDTRQKALAQQSGIKVRP